MQTQAAAWCDLPLGDHARACLSHLRCSLWTFHVPKLVCAAAPWSQFMGAISDEVREKDRIDEQKVIEARIREREVRCCM